jgi:hypothetical protein
MTDESSPCARRLPPILQGLVARRMDEPCRSRQRLCKLHDRRTVRHWWGSRNERAAAEVVMLLLDEAGELAPLMQRGRRCLLEDPHLRRAEVPEPFEDPERALALLTSSGAGRGAAAPRGARGQIKLRRIDGWQEMLKVQPATASVRRDMATAIVGAVVRPRSSAAWPRAPLGAGATM